MAFTPDRHSIHYNSDDYSTTAEFGGFWGFLMKMCELTKDCFIAYQGWIGYQATKEDTVNSVKSLIRKTLWLIGGHILFTALQMVFGSLSILGDEE